ncbi:MAG: hypothetical protein AB1705_02205 [Verrucomicrobiota bacterium]
MTKQRVAGIVWCVSVIATLLALLPVTVHKRTIYTCMLCRAERTNHTLFGYDWEEHRDTGFTGWYVMNRPAHEHEWTRISCVRGRNVFGMTTSWGCGPRHPLCDIRPEVLKRYAERVDQQTMDAYFAGVLSTNREMQKSAVETVWENIMGMK